VLHSFQNCGSISAGYCALKNREARRDAGLFRFGPRRKPLTTATTDSRRVYRVAGPAYQARCGAVRLARESHYLEVAGSNPAGATT
jgi:hypothetical protein